MISDSWLISFSADGLQRKSVLALPLAELKDARTGSSRNASAVTSPGTENGGQGLQGCDVSVVSLRLVSASWSKSKIRTSPVVTNQVARGARGYSKTGK
jgi:hypothetical protein